MLKYKIPQIVTLTPFFCRLLARVTKETNEIQKRFWKKEGMVDFNKKSLQEKYLESFHLLLCADDRTRTYTPHGTRS